MSDKKHIDRIFQEKLKDFEVSPKPQVWENIREKLNEQDEGSKKVYPLWLRISGIAVSLLLLFTLGSLILDSNNSTPDSKVVESENVLPATDTNKNNDSNINNSVTDNSKELDNSSEDKDAVNPLNSSEGNNNNDSTVIDNDNINNASNKSLNTESRLVESSTNSPLENSQNSVNSENKLANSNDAQSDNKVPNDGIAAAKDKAIANKNTKTNTDFTPDLDKRKANEALVDSNTNKDRIAGDIKTSLNKNTEAEIQDTNNPSSQTELNKSTIETGLNAAKNVADAVTENKTEPSDTEQETKIEDESPNEETPSIEEAIAEAEDIIEEEEEKVNRWQVYTTIAPVYYNTLGKGSHIDDQFVANPKNGEINASYGASVGYALNDKLTIRSGFNSLKLSYDTANVILYETVSNETTTNPLRNIVLSSGNQSLSALSADNLGVQQINGVLNDNYNAALSQRISYYEVPVELQYRIVNKQFGVNVIGGFSTFFLNGNEVYSEFDERKTYIGEANNINNVSFSGNLGLGVDYKFSKKLKFNLEPTFKYQLNAFNNTSGNFRPYIIGVYTGFSYKF